MVRQGDFEVSLVHADTKAPFKEHTKDGKVYVEVEPDFQRVGQSVQETLVATTSVDGTALGYRKFFASISQRCYAGLRTFKDGTQTHTAFKFSKPRLAVTQEGQASSRMLMGKVEVKIHTGILKGYSEKSNFQSNWNASPIVQGQSGSLADKNKALRSEKGSTSFVKPMAKHGKTYKFGAIVDVFTLNYCTALGLIHVGVLPKSPSALDHYARGPQTPHRTPSAPTTATSTPPSVSTIDPIRIVSPITGRVDELFDLTDL